MSQHRLRASIKRRNVVESTQLRRSAYIQNTKLGACLVAIVDYQLSAFVKSLEFNILHDVDVAQTWRIKSETPYG